MLLLLRSRIPRSQHLSAFWPLCARIQPLWLLIVYIGASDGVKPLQTQFLLKLRCPGGEKCAPSPSCSITPDLECDGPHRVCIDPLSIEAFRPSGAAVLCWCCCGLDWTGLLQHTHVHTCTQSVWGGGAASHLHSQSLQEVPP